VGHRFRLEIGLWGLATVNIGTVSGSGRLLAARAAVPLPSRGSSFLSFQSGLRCGRLTENFQGFRSHLEGLQRCRVVRSGIGCEG